ncbi:MAG: autotransporter outer membrane beta-barrel domain-containing protein, partial [Hyphomonadaceae bacterium]
TFGDGSQLGVLISDVPAESTFIESPGAITFAAGSRIVPLVPEGLPASGTQVFLTANGGLIGANNVTGPISGIGTPFVYNLSIDVAAGDPNSLEANFILKSAAELGLNQSQTAGYAAIIDALRRDNVVGDAFADLDTEFEFFDAYEDLMPSYSSAATELAATAIQQMQSATTNRLATTRLNESNQVSIWAQEIAYGLNREPPTANGLEFRGQGFGLAAGIDGPLNNGALFGLSASFLASEAEEPGRPEGEISTWFVQGNAYLGTAVGPFDLDFVGGVGGGKMTSRRFVEVGTFEALSEADWLALEAHGAARVSMPLALTDWFVVTPQAAVTYVGISEQGYTEEGGGAAIDYEVDDAFTQRLWGDVGVEFSARWTMRGGGQIAPRIFAGYRTNLIDEEAERTVRFVSGGPDFTVIDESVGEGGPLLGIGIDATNGYSTLSIGYEGEFGDQIERHSLNAALRFRF